MKLSAGEVRDIALESRLVLSEEELDGAERYINDFLDLLDRFKELDLRDVEAFSFAEVMACPLREDAVVPFPNREGLLGESAHVEGDYFKVPRIMEG